MRLRRFPTVVSLSVLAASLAYFVFAAPSSYAAPPVCFGKTATIVGTPGNDQLTGTSGPDVMSG